jgi:hypothetical protein
VVETVVCVCLKFIRILVYELNLCFNLSDLNLFVTVLMNLNVVVPVVPVLIVFYSAVFPGLYDSTNMLASHFFPCNRGAYKTVTR